MIKKIILLVGQYFTERDYARYGIELLQENGFDVSVYDLSSFIYPETIDSLKNLNDTFEKENIIRFDSPKKAIQTIGRENHETFFMTCIRCDSKTYKIFRAVSRAGFKYGSTGPYTRMSYPLYDKSVRDNPINRRKIDKHFINKVWKAIIARILNVSPRLLGINYASYFALAGGRRATAVGATINRDTYIQHIHSADYDSYLKLKKSSNEQTPRHDFNVYIDQNLVHNPDALIRKDTPKIDAKQYYGDLRTFFDQIESITHNKVVIAAHPKANYRKKEYLFGNREIVHGFNSAELISQSKLVLMHYSTAINLAVLFRKPIIFMISDLLVKINKGSAINNFAYCFGVIPFKIDDKNKQIELPKVDNKLYDAFISDFIKKPGTKDEYFWQQVTDYIRDN